MIVLHIVHQVSAAVAAANQRNGIVSANDGAKSLRLSLVGMAASSYVVLVIVL